jgi:hypothetical protein
MACVGEQAKHPWSVSDGPPRITAGIEPDEQIRREKWDLDIMEHCVDDAITSFDEDQREIGFVAFLGEARGCAAFGLGV